MSVEECSDECFGEVVGSIDRCVHTFQVNEVAFDPFAKGEVLDVDMSGTAGGFLCITHCRAAVVVFICYRCCFLWYVEVPKNASNE